MYAYLSNFNTNIKLFNNNKIVILLYLSVFDENIFIFLGHYFYISLKIIFCYFFSLLHSINNLLYQEKVWTRFWGLIIEASQFIA